MEINIVKETLNEFDLKMNALSEIRDNRQVPIFKLILEMIFFY